MKNIFAGFGLLFVLIPIFAFAKPVGKTYPPQKPRLVVLIAIDQFRADYLTRFAGEFLPEKQKNGDVGGFRYLMSRSAYYPAAQFEILQPMTGPGHSMLLSGTYPYQSGIPLNDWADGERGIYCTEGSSPKNIIGTNVSDEMKNAGYASKVVSIAIKDRAAILMGGHRADLALWFDAGEYRWGSSKFYLPDGELLEWIQNVNKDLAAKKGKDYRWEPLGKGSGLSLASALNPINGKYAKYFPQANFPHVVKQGNVGAVLAPPGAEMVEQAAEAAIDAMKLGDDGTTDFLSLGLSGHDYAGHLFGPNSREMEELTLFEDRMLAKFLNHLNRKVPGGLSQVVVVLTADHGSAANPEFLKKNHVDAGGIDEEALLKRAEAALTEKFGKPAGGKWFVSLETMNFFFLRKSIEKVSRREAEEIVKAVLLKEPGIAHAFSLTDYKERKLPPGLFEKRILNTYFAGRSGDVVGILKPYWFAAEHTVNHMAPYSYDESVPLLMMGPGFQPGVYAEKAEIVDLAPTLSFLLGVVAPTGSEGRVLAEAVKLPK